MLDRESELYNSGILCKDCRDDHAAIVITRDGVEISASTRGFRLNYSNRWDSIKRRWEEIDRRTRSRSTIEVTRVRSLEN